MSRKTDEQETEAVLCETLLARNVVGFEDPENFKTTHEDIREKSSKGLLPKGGQILKDMVDGFFSMVSGDGSNLATLAKANGVGRMFYFENRLKVLTPFNTIVDAQIYVDTLQERLLQLTTVEAEIEMNTLKNEIQTFTTGTFFDIIKLAFKRLLKRGKNNG